VNKIRNQILPFLPIPYHLPWGGWMLLENCEFGRSLIYGLYNEQDEINTMQFILRPGMTMFDIGANQGIFTIVASRRVGPLGRVYAFEPVPSQYQMLKLNCRLNGLKNVVTEALALSDRVGNAEFFEVEQDQANYSSLKPPASDVKTPFYQTIVKTVDLLFYMREKGINCVDFIKIDVEGGERDVIMGGESLWCSESAPIVLMEINDLRTGKWGYRAIELLRYFERWGYKIFRPTNGAIKVHKIQEYYSFTNLLLVPAAREYLLGPWIREKAIEI